MKSLGFTGLVMFLAVSLAFQSTACMSGAVYTVNRELAQGPKGPSIRSLRPGDSVEILPLVGGKLTGRYTGMVRLSTKTYFVKYEAAREKLKERTPLPALGEPITLLTNDGLIREFAFRGFDYGTMAVQAPGKDEIVTAELALLRQISGARGEAYDPSLILKLEGDGLIPYASAVGIKTQKERLEIPIDEIRLITVRNKPPYALYVVLGAVGVGLLVIAHGHLIKVGVPLH